MKILILGSGGREHALAEAVKNTTKHHEIIIAPGNSGIAQSFTCHKLDICDKNAVLTFAQAHHIELVIIGPEAPLACGIADILRENGFKVFGPNQQAAQLESSKIFARNFMEKAQVQQPAFAACGTIEEVQKALDERSAPYIVKADGLAAGKGVIVSDDKSFALAQAHEILKGRFGKDNKQVLVEDGLTGQEISLFVLTDGKSFHILPLCQDHKRIYDGDKGPNTGGMGAVCPLPWVSDALMEKLKQKIVAPTICGLKEQQLGFCGILFIGVMVDDKGEPWVLEYNTRFGDPEAEILLPALKEDWADIFDKTAQKKLKDYVFTQKPMAAATVILAAENYPDSPYDGEILQAAPLASARQKLYYSGVAQNDEGRLVSSGGRVLAATGLGHNLKQALDNAYHLAQQQQFKNAQMRGDIGQKTLKACPQIGIIMGSSSDVALLEKTVAILKDFDVAFEGKIASAHRTPQDVTDWACAAASKGIKVIIAAAGLSAALPGVVAAHSHLPVIGLPVESGSLSGLDALYSIAQMPPGVPVASVGINGAVNAALQALRICALDDEDIQKKLALYQQQAAEKVRQSQKAIDHWSI